MEMLPAMLNEDNVVEVYLIPLLIMLMTLFQCARMVLYSFLVLFKTFNFANIIVAEKSLLHPAMKWICAALFINQTCKTFEH